MTPSIRWAVLRDRFPFSVGEVLGHVQAPDKPTALEQARSLHGDKVLVQSVASRKVGARELQLPAPDPTRDRDGLKKRGDRRAYFRGRQQAKKRAANDPRGPRELNPVEPAVTNRDGDTSTRDER